jgi:hypothetical protein
MKPCLTLLAVPAVLSLALLPSLLPAADSAIEVGPFSAGLAGGSLPPGWKPLTFKGIEKHTVYTLVPDGNRVVLKADSEHSASGLIREIRINPKKYPIIRWRWKVMNILRGADVHRKEGDDYPARLYITFEYDPQKLGFWDRAKYGLIRTLYGQGLPLAAINYIWESRAPQGTMVPNPYTDRAIMIVVESGGEKLGQWVQEERNVYQDYKVAFGEEPPMISGVAVMTDTDNTGESAAAYYGDILFKKLEN